MPTIPTPIAHLFNPDDLHFDTLALRYGSQRTQFHEHGEPIFMTSSYVFDSAEQAAAVFAGQEEGYVYSRFSNPTVDMFQRRLAALEGAESCVATASGMSAIMACFMGVLSAGDHVVSSASIFGSTVNFINTILKRFGVEVTFVALTDLNQWREAIRPNTKLFFLETPSNPLTTIADIQAISDIAHDPSHPQPIIVAVDNCFCSPALQQPLRFGADVVIHSATKYIDGQGRALAGAVVGSKALIEEKIQPFLRNAGPTLSAFNAWIMLKGLETLSLRMEKQSANALALAQWLQQQSAVSAVHYPQLLEHPQHTLAMRQQKTGGAIVSFELHGGRDAAWQLINNVKLISVTANLGDTKTTITHPATTTHGRIKPEERAAAGISEGLIRIAVGLEYIEDVKHDLQLA
jgi:O-succinylhomoserine sulfhydrylase